MSEGAQTFLDGRVVLHAGDCLEVLRTIPSDSLDSGVMDPPYHLTSIVKRFGGDKAAPPRSGTTGVYARGARGFMGKTWDGGDIAFRPELWAEVLRVLKPGAHLVAFGAGRGVHRMACAIEDAGFEIRDRIVEMVAADAAVKAFLATLDEAQAEAFLRCCEDSRFGGDLAWVFGSGFPKSHDVAKGIDKAAGFWRGRAKGANVAMAGPNYERTAKGDPVTQDAVTWDGWGTALKPAMEPIVLARKPLDGTIVANVLEWGTGALNIDGCRVEGVDAVARDYTVKRLKPGATLDRTGGNWLPEAEDAVLFHGQTKDGRWPANVMTDGSDEVIAAFPIAPGQRQAVGPQHGKKASVNVFGDYGARYLCEPRGDTGSAARFFYSAKADADDRLGSNHPTVKPVNLMRWLVRLVTPPGGTVLDCFSGTGTTGEAAWREGMRAVLIEREAPYRLDIARRMALCLAGPMTRRHAGLKAGLATRGTAPPSRGPLFEDPATPVALDAP